MASGIDSDAAYIPAVNFTDASVDPTAPILGHSKLYVKDGGVYVLHHTGAASLVGAAPSLTTNRLGVGDGSGLLAALAIGSTGAVPTRQADGTVMEVVPSSGGSVVQIAELVVPSGGAASVLLPATGTIPGTYRNLQLFWQARLNTTQQALFVRYNGDTGSNYDYTNATLASVYGGATTYAQAGQLIGIASGTAQPANTANAGHVEIVNYTGTVFHKRSTGIWSRMDSESGDNHMTGVLVGQWRSTAAITTILVYPTTGSFIEGSTFTLYGLA